MEAKLIKNKYGDDFYYLMVDINTYATTHKESFRILSLKNCQAIERGYDLDELAKEFVDYEDSLYHSTIKNTYMHGFQKALEILGDKKFSEDDVNLAFVLGKNKDESRINKLINSRLQQTEWDVEIVMDVCGDKVYVVAEPLLDADGCLILKRI